MARGVAVVAVDSGGPAEFIDDRRRPACSRARASPRRWPTRSSRCSPPPSCVRDSAAPGASASCANSPTSRCAGAFFDSSWLLRSRPQEAQRGVSAAARSRARSRGERAGSRAAPLRCEVTIVAHDVGAVGGMERALAELALGLQRARPRGHGDRAHMCAARRRGVSFHRVRGPRRPFLIAYPWFMLAGSLALRRRRRGVVQSDGRDRAGPRRRASRSTTATRSARASPDAARPVPPARQARPAWLKRVAERLVLSRAAGRRRSCASPRASPRRCARTIPAVARARPSRSTTASTPTELRAGAAAADGRALRERLGIGGRARSSQCSSAASGSARASRQRSRARARARMGPRRRRRGDAARYRELADSTRRGGARPLARGPRRRSPVYAARRRVRAALQL